MPILGADRLNVGTSIRLLGEPFRAHDVLNTLDVCLVHDIVLYVLAAQDIGPLQPQPLEDTQRGVPFGVASFPPGGTFFAVPAQAAMSVQMHMARLGGRIPKQPKASSPEDRAGHAPLDASNALGPDAAHLEPVADCLAICPAKRRRQIAHHSNEFRMLR